MWFEDEDLLGRRLLGKHKKKKKPVLKVNVRLDVMNKQAKQKLAAMIVLPFVLIASVVLIYFLFDKGGNLLLADNSMFELRDLEIVVDPDAVITPQFIRQQAGLEPGVNLFDIPIDDIRSRFMAAPNIKRAELRRQLPHTLRIRITEREPMARIGRTGSIVVDADGYVFRGNSGLDRLPVIYGHKGIRLMPGSKAEGMTYAAVQVMDACTDPKFETIEIESIDVSTSGYITIWVTGGRNIKLSWKSMGDETRKARERLSLKLDRLRMTLESDEGRSNKRFDYTFEGRVYAE